MLIYFDYKPKIFIFVSLNKTAHNALTVVLKHVYVWFDLTSTNLASEDATILMVLMIKTNRLVNNKTSWRENNVADNIVIFQWVDLLMSIFNLITCGFTYHLNEYSQLKNWFLCLSIFLLSDFFNTVHSTYSGFSVKSVSVSK